MGNKLKLTDFTKNIILLFLVWRFLLFWISYFSIDIVPVWGDRFPYVSEYLISTDLPYWIWEWSNFDGVHYLSISYNYYAATYTQTFFPLFPLLIRYISEILSNNAHLVVGVILSSVFYLLALIMFSKLMFEEGYKKKDIYWTLLFVMLFPTSFYFAALYTESLFLLLILIFAYLVNKKKWLLAGFIGLLATATKLLGVLLLIFVLYDLLIKFVRKKQVELTEIISLFIIPLGLIGYMVFLQLRYNDYLMFWHSQSVFGAERLGSGFIFPPQVMYRYIKILLTVSPTTSGFYVALQEVLSFIGVLIVVGIGYLKKVKIQYLLFSLFIVIIPSLTGTFSSMPRYVLSAFPVFIILGSLKNETVKTILLLLFTILLFTNATLFLRGYWVA